MAARTLRNWFGLRCALRSCPHRWHYDETGCGGSCLHCGKLSGWLTRDELRAVADRMIDRERKP